MTWQPAAPEVIRELADQMGVDEQADALVRELVSRIAHQDLPAAWTLVDELAVIVHEVGKRP